MSIKATLQSMIALARAAAQSSTTELQNQADPIPQYLNAAEGLSEQRAWKAGPLSMELCQGADVPVVSYPASSGYDWRAVVASDALITRWGGAKFVTGGNGAVSSMSSSSWIASVPHFWEFGYDGLGLVIRGGVDTVKTKWLMWVDGKLASSTTDPYTATVGMRDVTITFGVARPRIITILSTWGASHITMDAQTRTLWKVSRPKGRCLGVIGDSWGDSSGEMLLGWGFQLGLKLGYSNIVPSFQGGTGYYNPGPAGQGRNHFVGRFAEELAPLQPDDFVVGGSINDLPGTLPGVGREAVQAKRRELFQAILSCNPKARIGVFGTQYVRPEMTAAYDVQDAEFQSVCSEFGLSLLSSSGWLTGVGATDAQSGSGNRDLYRGAGSADRDHLVASGLNYWATRQKTALAQLDPLWVLRG